MISDGPISDGPTPDRPTDGVTRAEASTREDEVRQLETLTTEQLRGRAFDKARDDHDLGFFWDLIKHLRASRALASEDGSGGGLTGSISELIELGRELAGRDLGEDEPLIRARFVDYLSS